MNADRPGVVFDCNVLLQAVANDQSAAAKALDFLENQHITLFVSEAVLSEVREVLARPKLRKRLPEITDARVNALLQRLANIAVLIQNVPAAFKYERDPKDEAYLNLAIVGKANYLVSRDKDLLDLMTSATEEARKFCSLYPFPHSDGGGVCERDHFDPSLTRGVRARITDGRPTRRVWTSP